jgi:hypothetical protein
MHFCYTAEISDNWKSCRACAVRQLHSKFPARSTYRSGSGGGGQLINSFEDTLKSLKLRNVGFFSTFLGE